MHHSRVFKYYEFENNDIYNYEYNSININLEDKLENNNNDNLMDVDCVICLEKNLKENNLHELSLHFFNYDKQCLCNGSFHTECLNEWYKIHNKCPICKIALNKKQILQIETAESTSIITNYIHNSFLYTIYQNRFFCIKIVIFVINVICFISFLFFFIFVLSMLIKVYSKYHD